MTCHTNRLALKPHSCRGEVYTPPQGARNFQINNGDADRHCKWNEGNHMPSAKVIEFDPDSGTANCRKNNNHGGSLGVWNIGWQNESDNYEEGVSFQRLCQGKYYNQAPWDSIYWDWQNKDCRATIYR
jgi:hypothetical protein